MSFKDTETRKAYNRAWYEKNREKVKAATLARKRAADPVVAREWRRLHEQKLRRAAGAAPRLHDAHVRVWMAESKRAKALHDAHVRLWRSDKSRQWAWRYEHDPSFKVKECLRRQFIKKRAHMPNLAEWIRQGVRAADGGRMVPLLGYTIQDLMQHLEAQFIHGMSWANYGKTGWHIDHILPKRCFDVASPQGVKAYWSLVNLRPLWARDNLRKAARIEVDLVV